MANLRNLGDEAAAQKIMERLIKDAAWLAIETRSTPQEAFIALCFKELFTRLNGIERKLYEQKSH